MPTDAETLAPASAPAPRRSGVAIVLRGLLYAAAGAAVLYAALHPVRTQGIYNGHEEWGSVQITQMALLSTSILAAALAWRSRSRLSQLMLLGALLLLMAFLREFDQILDRVFHGFWKVPAGALAVVAFLHVRRYRSEVAQGLRDLRNTCFAGLGYAGFVVLVVIAPTVGQQSIWRDFLADAYHRDIPRFVEELTELCGYVLLTAACIEGLIQSRGASGEGPASA